MKILQITRQFLPSTGGLESVVEGLSRAVQNGGHDVRVLTLRKIFATGQIAPALEFVNGLEVVRLKHFGLRRYPMAPQVLGHIRDYDLIHIHAIDFFLDFLSMSGSIHKRPLVVSTHGGFFHTEWLQWFKSAYFKTVTRQSLKHVAAVVCVSEHDYSLFSDIVPRKKLHLIRNGVVIEPYVDIKKQVTPHLIVGIGRLAPNKGIANLIKAVVQVKRSHPDVRMVWIGPDGDCRAADFRNLAQSLGVAANVEFTGEVPVCRIRELLTRAHVFVSPSSYEAYGLSTVEAMSSATVPVVTRVGIHPIVVKDGVTGFLMEGSENGIADALCRSFSVSPQRITDIGLAARKTAMECAWPAIAKSYLDLYNSVLS